MGQELRAALNCRLAEVNEFYACSDEFDLYADLLRNARGTLWPYCGYFTANSSIIASAGCMCRATIWLQWQLQFLQASIPRHCICVHNFGW